MDFKNLIPNKIIFLLIASFVFIPFSSCKEKKNNLMDSEWQEESLQLAGELCLKIKDCALQKNSISHLTGAQIKLLEKRFNESNCKEYHKKTKVFNLESDNPEKLKTFARTCYKSLLTLNCDQLLEKKFQEIPECENLKSIQ